MTPLQECEQLFSAAQTETQYRTVASRAYFATYNHVVKVAIRLGYSPMANSDDHQRLIQFCKSAGPQLLKRLGHSRLPRMRALRNHADYEQGLPFTEGMAEEALEDAKIIILEWFPDKNES